MGKDETSEQRSERILKELRKKYPGKDAFDLDGNATHFVCEVEPTSEHPEYDRAVEVMLKTQPHKHHMMAQYYKVLKGNLKLYVDDEVVELKEGDTFTIKPETVHWAEGNECWVELRSEPGWTKEDHIPVKIQE